jgi:hypothetical protein
MDLEERRQRPQLVRARVRDRPSRALLRYQSSIPSRRPLPLGYMGGQVSRSKARLKEPVESLKSDSLGCLRLSRHSLSSLPTCMFSKIVSPRG